MRVNTCFRGYRCLVAVFRPDLSIGILFNTLFEMSFFFFLREEGSGDNFRSKEWRRVVRKNVVRKSFSFGVGMKKISRQNEKKDAPKFSETQTAF